MTFIDDTEVRALELLTQAYIKRGHTEDSARAMSGHIELHEPAAFSAIVAALSQQPKGEQPGGSRGVTLQLMHWNGIPVLVTGTVTTSPGNWPLIDSALMEAHNG